MWRYASVLPDATPVTLGEGWTPLLTSQRYPGVLIKDEGMNPTGSSEARGLGLAVTMAKHYGIQHLTAASGGGALAAYAAAAGIPAHISMPPYASVINRVECAVYGADVTTVQGSEAWFDVSELKEPFRLEGEKTVGYEVVEQLGWEYPDAVFCPTGIGVLGIWKAVDEMEQLGWVAGKRPRIFTHKPFEDSAIDNVVRESGGRVVESREEDVLAKLLNWGEIEGIWLSLEGAAMATAYESVAASGELKRGERVVLINSGAGFKQAEAIGRALRLRTLLPSSLPVGGIITPQ